MPGTVALLAVIIGSTSFDGMRENQWWTDIALDIQGVARGRSGSARRPGWRSPTRSACSAVIRHRRAAVLVRRAGDAHGRPTRYPARDLARRFAHSLVPIAFAYVLAHYFSFLAYQGQAVGVPGVRPARARAGTCSAPPTSTIDYTVVSANGIWYVQVGALVIGHVAGLVLAHDRALVVFEDPKRATRSQYWMLATMVAFTSLGLWLLSSLSR